MARDRDHLDRLLADLGLDEDELLAWIEGEADDDADERVQRVLRAAPADAAKRVVAMRRDAVLLNSDRPEPAPPGLVADALARADTTLERDMLVGIEDGEPIPFNTPRISRPGPLAWMAGLANVRLAAAAILILAAGTAIYVLFPRIGATPILPPGPEIAMDEPDEEPAPPEPEPEIAAPDPTELAAADAPAEPEPAPAAEPAEPEPMPIDRALALASEGRLLITVRTLSAWETIDRLDALAARTQRARAWSISGRVPDDVVAALDLEGPAPVSIRPPPYAGVDGPPEMFDLPPAPQSSVFLAGVRAEAGSLEDLLDALGRSSDAGVELVELAEPIPSRADPELTREAVLWWGRPVTDWIPRLRVPVVVVTETDSD